MTRADSTRALFFGRRVSDWNTHFRLQSALLSWRRGTQFWHCPGSPCGTVIDLSPLPPSPLVKDSPKISSRFDKIPRIGRHRADNGKTLRTAAFFLELGRKSRGVPLPLVPLTRTGKRTPCKHVSQSSLERLLVWFLWIASGVHVVPGVAIHEGPACRIALISHWIASPTHVHGRARYRPLLLTVLGRIWRSSQDSRGHLLFLARRSIVRCSRSP